MTVLCQSSGGLNLSLHLEPSFIDFLVDQRIKQQNALDLSLNQHGVGDSKDPGSEEFLVVNKFMNKCFGSLSVKINSVPSNTNGGIFRNEPQVQPQPFAQKITTQCPNIVVKREVPPNEIRATEFVTIQQPDNGFRIPGVQIAATEVIPARFEARLPTVHDSMAFAAAPFVTEEQPQQQQQTTQQNHAMAAIVEQVTQQGISMAQVANHNNNNNNSGYSPAEEPENTSPTDASSGNIVVAIGSDQSGKPNNRLSDSAKRKRGRGKKSELGFQFGNGSPGGGGGVCKLSSSQASPRKVTSTKTFQCPLCEFSTPYYSSLDVHTKSIHSVERPFSCVLCEYTCKLKGNLKKHYMGIHKLESEPAASLLKHSSQAKEANNSSNSMSAQNSGSMNDGSSEDQGSIDVSMMDTKTVLQQVAESMHDEAHLQQYKVNSSAPPLVTTTDIETTALVSTAQQQSSSRSDDSSYIFQTVSSASSYVPRNALPVGTTKSDLRANAPPPILNHAPPGHNTSSDHNPGSHNRNGSNNVTTLSSAPSASAAATLVVVDSQIGGGGTGGGGGSMVSSSPPQTTMTSLTSYDPAASNIPDFSSVSASEVPALLMPQGYHATNLETFMPIRMEAHTIDGIEMMGTLDTQSDDENCGLIS